MKTMQQFAAVWVLWVSAFICIGRAHAVTPLGGYVDGIPPTTVDATVEQITSRLTTQNCRIYRVIDHGLNARNNGLELPDTKVILYSNDSLDEYLLMQNQLAAIDLPQKLLVRQIGPDKVRVDAKSATQLFSRHNIKPGDRFLRMMENKAGQFLRGPGIITQVSTRGFDATLTALLEAITDTPGFMVAGPPIDFTSAALLPTKLVIAGTPAGGTRLMQRQASIGIDLPLKILVWQDLQGRVNVSYNDAAYLAEQHEVTGADEIFAGMATRLNQFARTAAGIE